MKPNIPYIVTKASDDGTFEVGDSIGMTSDGSVINRNAEGWIDACDVREATEGMKVKIDVLRLEKKKQRLLKDLRKLEEMMNEDNTNASP